MDWTVPGRLLGLSSRPWDAVRYVQEEGGASVEGRGKAGCPEFREASSKKELLLFSLTHFFYLGLCSPWAW